MGQGVIELGARCPLVITNLQGQFLPPLGTYFCDGEHSTTEKLLASQSNCSPEGIDPTREEPFVSEKLESPHM